MAITTRTRALIVFTIPAVWATAGQAPAPPPASATVTIEQAVAEAIGNNPGLLAERLGIPVAEAAAITAGLRPNPVVSVSADHLDWLGTGYNEANAAGPPEMALRLDFPFERGRKRELRLDTAGYAKRIAQAKLADSMRRIRLDVTLACIDVMEAKARLTLARDNLASLDGIVQLNATRAGAGAIAPVELTRSRVAMLQFRSATRTAELALVTARIKLQTLLGRRPGETLIDVTDEMKPSLPVRVPELEQVRSAALSLRPDLEAIKLEQARSRSDLRLQIAQGKIDYSVGVEYRRQQGINGRGNSVGFFISAPLPVFNRNQGEIARAHAEQEQFDKSIQVLQAQITGEVVTAYREYNAARNMISEIERDLIKPSEEARDTTAYVYKAGASSLIDVLDAQRAFNETMSAYYGAQADYRRAASRLASVASQEVIP